jgi:hypothetical protein
LKIIFFYYISCYRKENLEAEKQAIMRVIARNTIWFNVNTEVDSTTTTMITINDTLLKWWRGRQMHSQPIISIEINGDSAFVSWARKDSGPLYLLIKIPDTTWLFWTKALSETVKINAIFLKTGDVSDTITRGWQLEKISLAWGQSNTVRTVRIDSLRIQSSSYSNLLITNPLETFFSVDSLISFSPGESVTLTLYTNTQNACAYFTLSF